MRYQIYEAKSVKHDAQQRVGMISLVNYQPSLNESEWHMDRLS